MIAAASRPKFRRSLVPRRWRPALRACLTGAPLLLPLAAAQAQSAPSLIRTVTLPEYQRGRNESVAERPRPDFDALGVTLGSFLLYPSVRSSVGATSNVLLNDGNKKSDVFLVIEPSATLNSNWSRHRVAVLARGDLQRYAREPLRNQNAWFVEGQGRLDVREQLKVTFDAQISRVYESPYTEDLASELAVVSNYLRKSAALQAIYTGGRVRGTLTLGRNDYSFAVIELSDDRVRDQTFRDRSIDRGSLIAEFALSPSLSAYAQANYDTTSYSSALPNGAANRDSNGVALLGGVNFDMAGLMRGAVGVGFTRRDYQASFYTDVSGLSVQARAEFFPSPLTTVGVVAQRQFQDANLGNGSAYTDTRLAVDVDHELLLNLILSANAGLTKRAYTETNRRTSIARAATNARFQMTRSLSISGNLSYGQARSSGTDGGTEFSEVRGLVSVGLRR